MTQLFERWTAHRQFSGVAPWMLRKCLMIVTVFIIFGSVITGIVLERFVAITAPQGYEDESGFHFGSERSEIVEKRRPRKSKVVRRELRVQTGVPVGH